MNTQRQTLCDAKNLSVLAVQMEGTVIDLVRRVDQLNKENQKLKNDLLEAQTKIHVQMSNVILEFEKKEDESVIAKNFYNPREILQ